MAPWLRWALAVFCFLAGVVNAAITFWPRRPRALPTLWMRVRREGERVSLDVSDDGREWLQMHSVEQEDDFAIVCKLEPLEGGKWPSTNEQN